MQQMSLREYIDNLERDGYTVRDDHGDDPVLIRPNGKAVETWREDYPYDDLMCRNDYEVEKYLLQIELLKFQYWAQDSGRRHVIVFEGRDAAGKGGTIKRFMEHLNPRGAPDRRADQAELDRAGAVVLPALHHPPADVRRHRAVRPLLVQPRGGRAGDGVLRRRTSTTRSCGRRRRSRRCCSSRAST